MYLRVEDVGVYWLVKVVLVSLLMEIDESIFKHLVDGGLPSASGSHTHEPMTYQHCLVQLDHLLHLYIGVRYFYQEQIRQPWCAYQ